MLPPTTSPTLKISRNSSRVTPSSWQRIDVIGDTIVAAQHQAGHQAEHFLGLGAEGARLVGAVVERKEAIDGEVARAEDEVIHSRAERIEVWKRGHAET